MVMVNWIIQALLVAGGVSSQVQVASQYIEQLPPRPDQTLSTCHDAAWEQANLVTLQNMQVHAEFAPFIQTLQSDAAKEGLFLTLNSTYRTCNEQATLRAYACGTGDYNMNLRPISECAPPTEPAGKSMHNHGLAVDFACSGYSIFESSPCYRWLKQHHMRYALIEHSLEPWHWSTTGK